LSLSLTNHTFVFDTTDLEKFSASLWAPTPHPTPIPVPPLAPSNANKENDNLDGDDSGADTEQEWLDESHFTELNLRFPSSVSEAMAIEVHQFFFFSLRLTDVFVEAIVAGFICGCFSQCRTRYPILGRQHVRGDGP